MPPEEKPPSIDSFSIEGATRFSEAELKDALVQHLGNKVTILNVQADLRAIASVYYSDKSEMTEGWSGFGLVTPKVTVTPEIAHPSDGHVTIKYIVKETE
jgi:outer membrane protein assembly factor BamA